MQDRVHAHVRRIRSRADEALSRAGLVLVPADPRDDAIEPVGSDRVVHGDRLEEMVRDQVSEGEGERPLAVPRAPYLLPVFRTEAVDGDGGTGRGVRGEDALVPSDDRLQLPLRHDLVEELPCLVEVRAMVDEQDGRVREAQLVACRPHEG